MMLWCDACRECRLWVTSYQVSGGVNEWCQIRSEEHRDQLQCDVRNERETEDSIRDDTQGNVMQGTQGRQGRGVAAARMWTVKWAGGESIKVTRISLRCPLHRSGITAADISQASLDTCVSPSPPLSSPAEFYPASPRAGAGRKQKQLPATRPGHRRHFPCELSAILILTLLSLRCIPGSCPAAWGHSASHDAGMNVTDRSDIRLTIKQWKSRKKCVHHCTAFEMKRYWYHLKKHQFKTFLTVQIAFLCHRGRFIQSWKLSSKKLTEFSQINKANISINLNSSSIFLLKMRLWWMLLIFMIIVNCSRKTIPDNPMFRLYPGVNSDSTILINLLSDDS